MSKPNHIVFFRKTSTEPIFASGVILKILFAFMCLHANTLWAQPNLTPYQPLGWSDKIVVTRTANSTTDSTSLTPADSLYLDWAVANLGNVTATGTFYTYLYVDGAYWTYWTTSSLLTNKYTYATNYFLGSLSEGTHTIEIWTDATGVISESNESDNTYTKTVTVLTPRPDLTKGTDNLNNLSPHPGDTISASITVQNQTCASGSASAGAFHVGFYFSADSTFSGVSAFQETAVSGCAANSTASLVQNITINPATVPGTYYLGYKIDDESEVGECDGNNNGIFSWTVTVLGNAPANDQCAGAIPMTAGTTYTVNTANATSTGDPIPGCQSNFGKGVWYAFTPATTSTVIISTCGSDFDTLLSVYTGSCGSLTSVACDDDDGPSCTGNRASVSFTATGGTTYRILAGGYGGASGNLSISATVLAGGTWTQLAHAPPGQVGLMLLLSDGTVMAASRITNPSDNPQNSGSKIWYKLTPDNHGSYINGNWTTLASMHDTRLWYSSAVLRDGRILVAGGEYGTGATNAEVYNPLSDNWAVVSVPPGLIDMNNNPEANGENTAGFSDSISKILANGNVLISPVYPAVYGGTVIFNPVANTWSAGPVLYRGGYQDEASWVKLPDDSILTIDPFGQNSERYIPASNTWIDDGIVPVDLYDSVAYELGAALLLPNGKIIFFGSTGHTALYTPSGNTSPGSWVAGPDFPNGQGTPDAPTAMMVNGKILLATSSTPTSGNHFPSPASFYEYDYSSGSIGAFSQVASPTGGTSENIQTFATLMLDLPDGTVLYSHFNTDLYVYQPTGSPLVAGKPTISTITQNADGSYHLTGTHLNGISEGAAYGDDAQMNSNYPLVRVTDGSGNVYYLRTYNWSSTGVMTGNTVVTTEFTNSAALPVGTYSLVVVANGISSGPFSFAITIAPNPPTANAATSVTSSSFTANWSSTIGAAGYRLDVSSSSTFTSYLSGYQDLDLGNILSRSITGLSAGTPYYYRVRAYNAGGTSGNSSTITSTTLPNPPAAPTANVASSLSTNGFIANWSSVGSATGYRLDVSTSITFGSFLGGYQDLDVGNALNQIVSGLSSGTTYYYRVRAYNVGGASVSSGSIIVMTLPATPTANAATSVTVSGFTANWGSVTGATGYRLDVSTSSTFSTYLSGYQNLDTGNVLSKSVTGLSAGATCYYRLRAYDGSGSSDNSGTITVVTVPSAPTASAASSVTNSGFTANWSSSSGAIGYRLDLSTNSTFTSYVSGYQDLNMGNALNQVVSGLFGGKIYYYRVRAYTLGGTSANSGTITTTTLPNPPAAPIATAATSVTNGGFSANWGSATGATGYRLDVSTDSLFGTYVSGYQDLNLANVTTKAVSGLSAGTIYYYRVRAYNTGGISGNSGSIIVITVPPAPVANAANNIETNVFTANWETANGATGYRLDVSTNSAFSSFVSGYQNLDAGNVLSRDVTGLIAGKVYYCRVRAYNGSGTSPNSATISIATPGPSLAQAKQGNKVILSWPTNDPALKLYYATNSPGMTWISNTASPSIVGGRYTITNSMTNKFKFFHLKK